jgi:hypothetical protein
MGLGSVGWDILCFLPEVALAVLTLGSVVFEGNRGLEALLENHFDGFERN